MDKQSEKMEKAITGMQIFTEKLIFEGLPERIARLNAILDSAQFKANAAMDVYEEIPLPQITVVNGSQMVSYPQVKSNNCIVDTIPFVKAYICELESDVNNIKMWILMLIPKMQAGDNLGVKIQEAIVAEIDAILRFTSVFRDSMLSYHTLRAQLVVKALKHPHVEDFQRAVAQVDENQDHSLFATMFQIRGSYSLLHDMIVKNIAMLKKPRSSNEHGMF